MSKAGCVTGIKSIIERDLAAGKGLTRLNSLETFYKKNALSIAWKLKKLPLINYLTDLEDAK